MIVLTNSWEPGRAEIKEVQTSDRVDAVILDARLTALEESANRLLIVTQMGFVLLFVVVVWLSVNLWRDKQQRDEDS